VLVLFFDNLESVLNFEKDSVRIECIIRPVHLSTKLIEKQIKFFTSIAHLSYHLRVLLL
jgi:hypothetical protein